MNFHFEIKQLFCAIKTLILFRDIRVMLDPTIYKKVENIIYISHMSQSLQMTESFVNMQKILMCAFILPYEKIEF